MSLHYFFENAWRWKCGLPEKENKPLPSLEVLRATEWDSNFERLMRNRLVMGAIRYGTGMGATNKPKYDRVSSMLKRLKEYEGTGNKELLVDTANLCMMEFVECHHPNAHFHATDETNYHVKTV